MKVKFKRKFLDYKKGDIKDLPKATAEKYIAFDVCAAVPPKKSRTKKVDAAPENKQMPGAANK